MKFWRSGLTTILAITSGVLCFYVRVKDGGNIDYYWKPLVVGWLAVTLLAFAPLRKMQALASIRERWWLQIIVPIALFFVAGLLVRVHEPHPMRKTGKSPNQALQHNDHGCHGLCVRTIRASHGRG